MGGTTGRRGFNVRKVHDIHHTLYLTSAHTSEMLVSQARIARNRCSSTQRNCVQRDARRKRLLFLSPKCVKLIFFRTTKPTFLRPMSQEHSSKSSTNCMTYQHLAAVILHIWAGRLLTSFEVYILCLLAEHKPHPPSIAQWISLVCSKILAARRRYVLTQQVNN